MQICKISASDRKLTPSAAAVAAAAAATAPQLRIFVVEKLMEISSNKERKWCSHCSIHLHISEPTASATDLQTNCTFISAIMQILHTVTSIVQDKKFTSFILKMISTVVV